MSDSSRPGFEGGLFLPFKGVWPRIGNDVFIAPTATVIGDVEIADEAVVMYGCTVRGDTNWIKIGKRSNLQDHVVIHVNEGGSPTSLGDRVSVGHSVLLHACELLLHQQLKIMIVPSLQLNHPLQQSLLFCLGRLQFSELRSELRYLQILLTHLDGAFWVQSYRHQRLLLQRCM